MQIDETAPDIREMSVVHIALRREYGLLPDLVGDVATGDTERAALVAEHIAFLNSVLHRHHTGEDEHLWPRLLTRAAASLAPLVHTVETQHHSVDLAMAELRSVLDSWRLDPGPPSTTAVVEALEALTVRLEEHLDLEERELLPLIERHITAEEWTAMGEAGAAGTPPDQAPLIFGMMMYEGDPEVLEDMFAHMPAEVAAVLGELAPAAYQDYCHTIHGTAAPRLVRAG